MTPFRLGVITDEISGDLEHALDVMLEYNVRQVELRELWGKNVLKLDPDELSRARRAILDRGMQVCSIASPFYKCSLQPGNNDGSVEKKMHGAVEVDRSEQMAILEQACHTAHFFGTDLVRVFAFWRDQEMTPEVMDLVKQAFEAPLKLADREEIVLGLENEHACLLGTGEETGGFLREIKHPRLRSVWDPGNAFQLGERSFPIGYDAVKEYMVHVHVKDARKHPDGKRPWTVIGDGDIDYKGQLRALVEDDYTGVVSLETHYRGVGGDPEASSRECLQAVLRMLSEF